MRVYCGLCQNNKKVVGYVRDDPMLECGHVHTIENSPDAELIDRLYVNVRDRMLEIMRRENITWKEAMRRYWKVG